MVAGCVSMHEATSHSYVLHEVPAGEFTDDFLVRSTKSHDKAPIHACVYDELADPYPSTNAVSTIISAKNELGVREDEFLDDGVSFLWLDSWPLESERLQQLNDGLLTYPFVSEDLNEGIVDGVLLESMSDTSSGECEPADSVGFAGGPPQGFGGPNDIPGYGASWYTTSSVLGQGSKLAIFRQRLGVDIPVWFEDADAIMASVNVEESHFSGQAILPDTLREFPSDLWSVQLGLEHMRQYSNGWSSMLMFDVGSASDRPFQSIRNMNVQLGGFLIIPASNERDSWIWGAIYSPLGSPNFPIPLLSYSWRPSEAFQMNIGLPCSLKWNATDRLCFDVSYFPILSVNALATYKLSELWHTYGGYQNVTNSWFLNDRAHQNDQFFAVEQRLIAGVRRDVSENVTIDVNAGYAFGRHYGVGTFQSALSDRVNLEAAAFLAGQVTWSF